MTLRTLAPIGPLVLASGLFAALVLLVHARLLAPLDEAALQMLARTRMEALGEPMNWAFRLGFIQVDAAVALAWSGWLLARRRSLWAALPPLALFAAVGLQAGLRLVVDQPAPSARYAVGRSFAREPVAAALDRPDAAARQVFTAAAAAATAGQPRERGSFPSGHATRVLFLALLGLGLGRVPASPRLRVPASLLPLAAAGVVGYSAMYFGYHWPSDVVGGYLLALAAYLLAVRLNRAEE